MSEDTTHPPVRGADQAALRRFARRHGGAVRAVVSPLGRPGTRLCLVGADGALGDLVVRDDETARRLCAAVPGVEVSDWDQPTVAALAIGPEHRRRMAGPRARGR
ncbi:hypothetical protein [Actinoalloteichus spitiensis]|uniref:hypothetical protein n=1 Tax=Actinoalloteichus spitiensis TaxID=252394 RepID=UPI0003696DAA|nr:hypothetical protein [Actinoalloteichus spitiensis]